MKYHVGQYILYRGSGVCKIEAIGRVPFSPDTAREYYTLRPPFTTCNERIYAPISAEQNMKNIMTKEEARAQMEALKSMHVRPFSAKKTQLLAEHYQELLSACEVDKHLQLFKEICLKEKSAPQRGKKLAETERRFKQKTERRLSEEFAIALNEAPAVCTEQLYQKLQ